VEKEITELKETHPNLSVIHGGLGGYVKPKPRQEPLSRLCKHLEEHNIKMIDVFKKFDPDNSTTVSEPSFREAIKVCVHVRMCMCVHVRVCVYIQCLELFVSVPRP